MSTDELSRLRHAFTAVPPGAVPRVDCPPAGRIWEGSRGELGPAEFRELIHHLANCPVCTEAWQLADKLEASEEDFEEEAPLRQPSTFRHRGSWAAGTAAAAVVFLAVGLEVRDWTHRVHELRAPTSNWGGQAPAHRAPATDEIELLNKGPVSRNGFVLRWRGPEDAAYYDLRVSLAIEPGRTVAGGVEIRAVEFQVPPEALAKLPAGAVLLVSLEAFHPTEGPLDADSSRVTLQ